jgi:hypothetical protein
MLAQFGQPVAVLTARPAGSTLEIGGGGFNDQIWCIDVDYRLGEQLAARVRTIRELTPMPAHGAPGDFLHSALIEFSVNAELASGTHAPNPDKPRGQQLTLRREQQAASATPAASHVTINGDEQPAVSLQIPGYRAHLTILEQSIVVYVGNVDAPTLRMTTTPG